MSRGNNHGSIRAGTIKRSLSLGVTLLFAAAIALLVVDSIRAQQGNGPRDEILANSERMLEEGVETFRFETFGDEAFWGDTLKLHEAIQGSGFGGVGPGLSPRTALSLGLKVDSEALPKSLVKQLKRGRVDLDAPATTLALLKADSVVGVKGFFDSDGRLRSVGLSCALCHSTVDNTVMPGVGRRLDAWANRDLNVGGIVALAPDLTAFATLLGVDVTT